LLSNTRVAAHCNTLQHTVTTTITRAPPAACATFPTTVEQLPSLEEMKAKFPTANFTSLIAKIAEDKLLAAQKEQARLGWQMQSARNHVMRVLQCVAMCCSVMQRVAGANAGSAQSRGECVVM